MQEKLLALLAQIGEQFPGQFPDLIPYHSGGGNYHLAVLYDGEAAAMVSENEGDDKAEKPFFVAAWADDWDMADPPVRGWYECADAAGVAQALVNLHTQLRAAGYSVMKGGA